MKKRILSAMFILIALFNLVGCSLGDKLENGQKSKDFKIKVQVEEKWLPYYEKVRDIVLKKYNNANIEFKVIDSFKYLNIIQSNEQDNEESADLYTLPVDRVEYLVKNKKLMPIDAEKIAKEIGGFKNFKGGLGTSFNVKGQYFAFPYNIETLVAFVNVENARNAGIDISESIEFTDLSYEQMLVSLKDIWLGVAFANSADLKLLTQVEKDRFNSDLTKDYTSLSIEKQQLIQVLFNYWKDHDKNNTDLWNYEKSEQYMESSFETGKRNVIRIDGPWIKNDLIRKVADEENLEVIPLGRITVNGKKLKHWKSGWGLGISSRIGDDNEKINLVLDFIKELVNPNNAVKLFETTGKILENADCSDYDSLDSMSKKIINATYESYEYALELPNLSQWENVGEAWENALLSWQSLKPDNVEEAYGCLKDNFNALIKYLQ